MRLALTLVGLAVAALYVAGLFWTARPCVRPFPCGCPACQERQSKPRPGGTLKYRLRILRYLVTGRQLPPHCASCGLRCFGGWLTGANGQGTWGHWCLQHQ